MEFAGLSHYFILLCLPFGLLCSNINDPINGNLDSDTVNRNIAGRVINGHVAKRGQFPHQVSVRHRFTDCHFAGGAIIAPQWVLTVASVLDDRNPEKLSVAAGHVVTHEHSSFIQRRNVSAMIIHKDWERGRSVLANIALLKVAIPFDLNTDFVKVAPMGQKMPLPGTQCEVAGWGPGSYNSWVLSNRLMYAELPLIEKSECKKYQIIAKYMGPGTFCAGYASGFPAPWLNDEGGALICGKSISGLVSGQLDAFKPTGSPGIFTDVTYHYDWVINQMKTHDETDY